MQSISQQLPDSVLKRANSIGASGTQWLARLDAITNDIATDWHLTIGKPISGGTESLVLPVTLPDQSHAILKIGMPTVCDTANEARILRIADGRGYARLLNQYPEHNAILIEKLGPSLANLNKTTAEQIEIICATLKSAWFPIQDANGFMTGAEKAQWLADFIDSNWKTLNQPCKRATRNMALGFAEERAEAFDPITCVLVHGDAHEANTLQTIAGDGYKFVDPDGLFAEPGCDLAVPMREWGAELLAGDAVALGQARCETIAQLTGVNKTAIWQWGFMERVSTGLVLIQIGMPELADEYLQVADLWINADLNW